MKNYGCLKPRIFLSVHVRSLQNMYGCLQIHIFSFFSLSLSHRHFFSLSHTQSFSLSQRHILSLSHLRGTPHIHTYGLEHAAPQDKCLLSLRSSPNLSVLMKALSLVAVRYVDVPYLPVTSPSAFSSSLFLLVPLRTSEMTS